MKNLKYFIAALATTSLFISCNNDDNEPISGNGNLGIEFDNAFKNDDLILNTQANTTSLNEILKIGSVKYIVSNIVLTNEDGTTYTYPKDQSYFIVDESTEGEHVLELGNIPAGNYTKVRFGIGIDQDQYDLGEAAQGDFLATALASGMISDWSEGYKNLSFEGTFTSPTVASAMDFMIQTGKRDANYNYTEITLNLPTKALVRTDISPEIHIIADVSKIIDGANKIALSDHISGGNAAITTGETIDLITENISEMFTVAHVHND